MEASKTKPALPEWWMPRELANLLRYHVTTVLRWCESEKIIANKMPGGTWRIHRSVVEEIQAGGLPEKRRLQQAKVDPIWEASHDYFAESKPKARA